MFVKRKRKKRDCMDRFPHFSVGNLFWNVKKKKKKCGTRTMWQIFCLEFYLTCSSSLRCRLNAVPWGPLKLQMYTVWRENHRRAIKLQRVTDLRVDVRLNEIMPHCWLKSFPHNVQFFFPHRLCRVPRMLLISSLKHAERKETHNLPHLCTCH